FSDSVALSIQDDVAIVKLNCKNVKENTLNKSVSEELKKALERIQSDSGIRSAVIISGKPNSFIAGADIDMLSKGKSATDVEKLSQEAQREFAQIESSRKPIVAAIMGTCMGGGLELAMACQYRIAVNTAKTQLGLPEVMLGLLPGAGGTQRLPKLVSISTALDMMLTGKALKPSKAKKVGLVDHVIDPIGGGLKNYEENNLDYLEKVAVSVAKQLATGALKPDRTRPFLERTVNYFLTRPPLLEKVLLRTVTKKVMSQTAGNYPAPLRILDVVKSGLNTSDGSGYDRESRAFGELSQTSQSKALVGIFNSSTACKKNKWGKLEKDINKIAVVGAGLMGAGITNVTVDKGIKTTLIDMHDEGLARGLNQIYSHLNTAYKRKKIGIVERDRSMAYVKPTTTYEDLQDCDVVVEAVFEEIGLKHKIITQLESVVSDKCVIASNTSALPIKEIASVARKPERIIGMHYFSPVEKMQLLEIITTEKTSKETLKVAANLGLRQKKLVVVVKDCPGFFVVRCLAPMMSEVSRLIQEGVSPEELDKLTKSYGFPVGAATLGDEVGLDVAEHVAHFLGEALGPRMGGGSVSLLSEMVSSGFKGRKSGKGYYIYGKGKKGKKMNDAALKIISRHRITAPAAVSGTEDQQLRIICRYINEAAICLQENVISSPSDGDVASVFGIGFPPFWGGPFRFIDLYGADKLIKNMSRFAEAYSAEQFQPAQLLIDHAKEKKKFYPG
ncbi:unnamed protein product, partial [Enterobius vermicularis]|uniref:Trifunctional enzyme subunit alpha, mitochondrial n=1 Tax=Enterobius vermicularis TaxID=51028 RepID=A0A0N4VEU7_ENTVE